MFGFKKDNTASTEALATTPSQQATTRHWGIRIGIAIIGIYLLACVVIGMYWSSEPSMFSVEENAQQAAATLGINSAKLPSGFMTTETLKRVAATIINKPGGYLSNDIFPPGLWLDNIPSWEYGVLMQVRDMTQAMRKDIARSQSQSTENINLVKAEESFNADSKSWLFPPAEDRYNDGIKFLTAYEKQLLDSNDTNGKFYPRADNLTNWLKGVETRLGSLSQRLSASVGQENIDIDADDVTDTLSPKEKIVKTPWLKIDNVFYEARGQAWALAQLLRAVEVDFHDILAKKEALVSLKQIIRDLEATQQTIWSPLILNGSGFGFWANHSLVMANYISRANAAVMDLRRLLEQG